MPGLANWLDCLCFAALVAPVLAQQPAPRDMVAWGSVRVHREAGGGPQLQVLNARGEPLQRIGVPLQYLTAARPAAGGYLVGGATATGEGRMLAVLPADEELVLGKASLALPSHPLGLALQHGYLALWLADGRVLAAPWDFLEALPGWGDFEQVGEFSPKGPAEGMWVTPDQRIVVAALAGSRVFRAVRGGAWQLLGLQVLGLQGTAESRRTAPSPARIGAGMVVGGFDAGDATLWAEGGEAGAAVVLQLAEHGQVELSAAASGSMRADQRYCLRRGDRQGSWFYPAAIRGTVWAEPGVELTEVLANEGLVRLGRGAAAVRAQVGFALGLRRGGCRSLCLATTSRNADPVVVERGGRSWLQPTRLAEQVHEESFRQQVVELTVPVPVERAAAAGLWLHLQFAILDHDRKLLGVTGVRSIPVLPDDKRITEEEAARLRGHAERFWLVHGVRDPQAAWQELTAVR